MMTTVEARIDPKTAPELIKFAREEMEAWNRMARQVWHHLNHPERSDCPHHEWLKKTYGIKERTANSIVRTITGRRSALLELKKSRTCFPEGETEKKAERIQPPCQCAECTEDAGGSQFTGRKTAGCLPKGEVCPAPDETED